MKRLIFLFCFLASCAKEPLEVKHFTADNYPEKLSSWGLMDTSGDFIQLESSTLVYDIATPLFSDYAQKFRTLYIPPDGAAVYQEDDVFELPVGTIISKTFYYRRLGSALVKDTESQELTKLNLNEIQLIETRLLVHQSSGWEPVPYIWDGEDAYLKITGDLQSHQLVDAQNTVSELNYLVPTRNECAGCHVSNHSTGEFQPIGLKARHLNRPSPTQPGNQLTHWESINLLKNLPELATVARNATSAEDTLEHQALSYLDINCGHCHSPVGPADTSGLYLNYPSQTARRLGICKPPVAAGRGTGNRVLGISPGKPDDSILLFRLETNDPGSRMPEIGRTLQHTEGTKLISDWISALPGECQSESDITFNSLSS